MAATKRFVNVTAVGWTPSGGSLTTLTGVTNVSEDPGGNLLEFSGDADALPTTIISDYQKNTVTITLADLSAIRAIPSGTRGTLVYTRNDAKNKSTTAGGALIFTLINAVCRTNPTSGAHRQFASGTVTFEGESADGTTPALSTAAA